MNTFYPAYFKTRFYAEKGPNKFPNNGVILSAFATTGQVWSSEKNRQADLDLEGLLRTFPNKYLWRLIGYSPDDQHAEPSWLIDLDCQIACEIGLRFEQDALYRIEEGELLVVRCNDAADRARVGRFDQRIDWLEPQPLRERLERCWPISLEL